MAEIVRLDDPSDPRLDDYRGLTDAAARRRADVFICEGTLAIRRAVEAGVAFHSLLLLPAKQAELTDVLDRLHTQVYVADLEVLRATTGFDIHRGAVAAAVRPAERSVAEATAGAHTVAVVEGVNDLENLGAIFRNAAAFAVDAVVLDPTTADPYARRAVRVSTGHVLHVPHARSATWAADLRNAGFTLVALTPHGEETELPDSDRVALLLGAEGPGLSDAALAAADHCVRIPIAPGVDSLNVATAAAIMFQRRFS